LLGLLYLPMEILETKYETVFGAVWSFENLNTKVIDVTQRLKYENNMLREILKMNDLDFAYEDGNHFIFADLQTQRLLTNLVNINFKGQKAYVFDTIIDDKLEKVLKIGDLNFCSKDLYDIYQFDDVQVTNGSFYDDRFFEDNEFIVFSDEEEVVSSLKIDNLFELTKQTRVERKHKIYIKKEDPEYFTLLKMGDLNIPILDAARNYMVFFEHPIQHEMEIKDGVSKKIKSKHMRFTQYRREVVKNLDKIKIDEQIKKLENFYGASVLFAIKNENLDQIKRGFDVVLLGYNSMKVNPIMSCEVSSINLNRYIGDMILLGTVFFQNFRLTDYGVLLKNDDIDRYKVEKFFQDIQINDTQDYDYTLPKFDFKMDKQFVNFQVQFDGKLFLVNLPVKINSEEDFVFFDGLFWCFFYNI